MHLLQFFDMLCKTDSRVMHGMSEKRKHRLNDAPVLALCITLLFPAVFMFRNSVAINPFQRYSFSPF